MIDPESLGVALLLSIPAAILFTLFAGINRIPWRYAMEIGVGSAAILALSNIATRSDGPLFEPGQLVLIGAILGGLVVRAYERGIALRRAEVERILALPESTKP
jgi:ABC-type Fe3+-siderophore transport system permease subunit